MILESSAAVITRGNVYINANAYNSITTVLRFKVFIRLNLFCLRLQKILPFSAIWVGVGVAFMHACMRSCVPEEGWGGEVDETGAYNFGLPLLKNSSGSS